MSVATFKKGIHPPYNKQHSSNKEIQQISRPDEIVIPLQQHIGAPLEPVVTRKEQVKKGQLLADSDSFVTAPVHASLAGEVKAVEKISSPQGGRVLAVRIKVAGDQQEELAEAPGKEPEEVSPEDIRKAVRQAGIAGMGGAMFPTHVKLAVPEGKSIDYLIINGAECEPYLTVDHRIMLERGEQVVDGLRYLMRATGADRGLIGIEDNKPDAIKTLKSAAAEFDNIEVRTTETKYPQGGEKMLIKALLDRDVPVGGLPLDVGVVVNNVATATAVAAAVREGRPLIDRPLTITGEGINNPGNFEVPLGTPVGEVIKAAGGFAGEPGKVILGGPMMGQAQASLDVPVVKGTSGILVLTRSQLEEYSPVPCINCARCVDACPMYLVPARLEKQARLEELDKLEEYQVMNCIECGSCSYVCPAQRPLVHYIRVGKAAVTARKKSEQGGS